MHLGLVLPNYGPYAEIDVLSVVARSAEENGFTSGWVTDHIQVPLWGEWIYGNILEATVTLAALTGRTSHLSLGISAFIVPLRRTLIALKQISSLQVIAGDRLIVAIAPGWLREEFEIIGAPFSDRIEILNDWLERMLSPGDGRGVSSHSTETVQSTTIWAAGMSSAAICRACRTGVWHPVGLGVDELAVKARRFREVRPDGKIILRIGVDMDPVEMGELASSNTRSAWSNAGEPLGADEKGHLVLTGNSETIARALNRYVEAGSDGFVVNLGCLKDGLEERVEGFAKVVWPLVETRRAWEPV